MLIKIGLDAQSAMLKGINTVADVVRSTYGPNGKQVALRKGEFFIVTNDGKTVAENIHITDRFEKLGADIFNDIVRNTDKRAGDGRTTAVIIGQELANSLKGGDMSTYRALNKEKDIVVSEIAKLAKPVKTNATIKEIATLSSESEEIGTLIAQAFNTVGNDGVVKSEDGDGVKTELEIAKGFEVPQGYKMVHMVTDPERMVAEHKNVHILVTDHDIKTIDQLLPILEELTAKKQTAVVIFAASVSKEVANTIAFNKLKGAFVAQVVELGKVPKNTEYYDDIATLTGAQFIDSKITLLEDVNLTCLGKAQKVEVGDEKTTIINDRNLKKEIALLKKQKDTEHRVARLTNGVALIKVGAQTQTERDYLSKKVRDAINATKASIEEGVVIGAGQTLKTIAEKYNLPLLGGAITEPYNQLKKTNTVFTDKILDPAKVLRVALESACSVVGVLLTTDTLALDEDKKEE